MKRTLSIAAAGLASLIFFAKPLLAEDFIINFRDADIRALVDDISMMTGRTFIMDPRVRGNITVFSHQPIEEKAIFDLFLSTLRVYGFTAVPTSSGAYKIVPDETAALDGSLSKGDGAGDDVLITEIFRVNNVNALTVMNTIKPIINRQGRVIANRGQNYILVVEYSGNLDRIRKIVQDIDRDTSIKKLITLENVNAQEMSDILSSMRGGPVGEEEFVDTSFVAIPVISSNTLILKGQKSVVDELEKLAIDLDQRGSSRGDIRVISLRYANASEMKPVLENVTKSIASNQPGEENQNSSSGPRASIDAHLQTNSLIISAGPAIQKELSNVIRLLDAPRAQVLVEAIIVEASDNVSRDLGIQYFLSGSEGSSIPFTATNFENSAPNILAATGALALPDDEFGASTGALAQAAINSLITPSGLIGGFAGQAGESFFGVVFNALQNDVKSNILSTPFIMTLDNEAAELVSGQQIPVTAGESLGANNTVPFRTVERIDVGIKLNVTPNINEDGQIRMKIFQEVSSVEAAVGNTLDIITNKRSIETTITVGDGEVIVLGGLIQEDETLNVNKVPFLGDIPILGRLFRSEGKSKEKRNLMVFLRPTVVRDSRDSHLLTKRKIDIAREGGISRRDGSKALDGVLQNLVGKALEDEGGSQTGPE